MLLHKWALHWDIMLELLSSENIHLRWTKSDLAVGYLSGDHTSHHQSPFGHELLGYTRFCHSFRVCLLRWWVDWYQASQSPQCWCIQKPTVVESAYISEQPHLNCWWCHPALGCIDRCTWRWGWWWYALPCLPQLIKLQSTILYPVY